MNDDLINIAETKKFDQATSYLTTVRIETAALTKKLGTIGSSTSGSLTTFYNQKAKPVKEEINKLHNLAVKAQDHINNSISLYCLADENIMKNLNEIVDDIFDNKDFQSRIMYYKNNNEKDKISYEEFVDLLNSSEKFFNEQREKVYNEFLTKMVTASPTIIKKLGTTIFNSIVENTYFFISTDKAGSNRYIDGLNKFKNKFGQEIKKQYDNYDFIPECYTNNQNDYNKALLALSFDNKSDVDKYQMLMDTFHKIDSRTYDKEYEISQSLNNLNLFYQAKGIFTRAPANATPKELLDYYSKTVNGFKELFQELKDRNGDNLAVESMFYESDPNAWYDAIKNTKAFKLLKSSLSNDKNEIFNLTNSMDFLAAVYQYDGMDALQTLYSKYVSKCTGEDVSKSFVAGGDLDKIITYSTWNNILGQLYQPITDTYTKLNTIDDTENTALLQYAKDLDTSDINYDEYKKSIGLLDLYWTFYCDQNDYKKYLEDWQLKAYAKILSKDKDLANKLFNISEGRDRGVLNEKIMQGYAFDVAKTRVEEMTQNKEGVWDGFDYLRDFLFSTAYGFGYGFTDFTTGIADVFCADGKPDRRQMEQTNILALLSGNYDLQSNYYNKDPKTMEMFSSDYSTEFINSIRIKNFSREDIDQLIKDCKDNKIPRYELEYYLGNISYNDYIKYQSVANLSNEDLAYYAKLKDNSTLKWLNERTFKVSNTIGTMAIPIALSTAATALGPIGGISLPWLTTSSAVTTSTVLSSLSYGSMFASILGRNMEQLRTNGETNDGLIWTNSILHAAFETFGEMALGKLLKPTKLTSYLKETTAKNHPVLGALFNASDNLNNFLIKNNCNPRLAKYLSSIAGEVLQENLENIVGYGVDAATYAAFKGEAKLPTFDEMLKEAWETTWTTALTTPILNGFTDLSLANVHQTLDFNGRSVRVSLSDMLMFLDETTNEINYQDLSKYLAYTGKSNIPYVGANIDSVVYSAYLNFYEYVNKGTDNISVFNENNDNVSTFSRNELLRIISLLETDEGKTQLKDLQNKLRNNKRYGVDIKGETFAGYSLAELSAAMHMLKYNGDDYINHLNVINDFDTIFQYYGGKEVSLRNIKNLSNDQLVNILNSDLDYTIKNDILKKLSESKEGIKFLLENKILDLPSIEYVTKGSKVTLDGNKYFNYLLNIDLDYKKVNESVSDGLTQGDIATILLGLSDKYVIDASNANLEKFLLENLDEGNLNLMNNLNTATEKEKEFILWAQEELPNILATNQYISTESLNKLTGTFHFFEQKNWQEHLKTLGYTFEERSRVLGVHEGKNNNNTVKIVKDKNGILHTTVHEANHGCGNIKNINNRGLNESLTEHFTRDQLIKSKLMDNIPKSGYAPGVNGVELLLQYNIPGLTENDFAEAYYVKHSDSDIKTAIDDIMGPGYYDKTLSKAFDTILVDYKGDRKTTPSIDKVINDIIYIYETQIKE